MSTLLPGFKGEYLWEFDIAERQRLHWRRLSRRRPMDGVLLERRGP